MLYTFPAAPREKRVFSRPTRCASSRFDRPLKPWESCIVGSLTGLLMGFLIALALLLA